MKDLKVWRVVPFDFDSARCQVLVSVYESRSRFPNNILINNPT